MAGGLVGQVGCYELADYWRKEIVSSLGVVIPKEIFNKSGKYQVRARWRDLSGRCSHWSSPVLVTVP